MSLFVLQEKKLSEDNVKDLSGDIQVSSLNFLVLRNTGYLIEFLGRAEALQLISHIGGAYAMQKMTDDYIKKVEALFKQKEKVSLCYIY